MVDKERLKEEGILTEDGTIASQEVEEIEEDNNWREAGKRILKRNNGKIPENLGDGGKERLRKLREEMKKFNPE